MKTIVESDFATTLVTIHLEFTGGGAVHEPADRSGLAALTSQMLHRGAGDLSAHALASRFDGIGAAVGSGVGRETSSVTLEVIPKNVGAAVELLRTMLEIRGATMVITVSAMKATQRVAQHQRCK